ncbi:hypothetical protein DelCs14_2663 [Delftia sp. Cs1-4]|uniref:hypothetical protein n=1 Tax=Delftia sp. (strain Cs1-4) TaxID=742013 RepID=UPI00020E8275|nr:hypothetical protein [Delftia sp. Cs1-4]AEF89675.1 hypothetical protein DelCs14_2663 [Delftia sp. Cs1-4]
MLPDTRPPIQLQQLPRRKKPARQRASLLLGLAALIVLGLLALTGCADVGAQEPQPTPEEQRIARAAARACEGLTPVFEAGSVLCFKER